VATEVVIRRPDLYPLGTTVQVYENVKESQAYPLTGEPKPSGIYPKRAEATATAVSATFTGLTAGVKYVAWAI
jgi:hypothetical protein